MDGANRTVGDLVKELKLDDDIEVIGLANRSGNGLHRAGIHQVNDILKSSLDELAGLGNIQAAAKAELRDRYQDIKGDGSEAGQESLHPA